ncbi:MAG: hypothetical protein II759_00205 [Lachnospiraceae bacterium]|nr:hypothetical protein [Lachnospiraceae bacterium]
MKENGQNSPWTLKRILALAAVILLAGLYIVTLFAALTARPGAAALFRACLILTVMVPAVSWILIRVFSLTRGGRDKEGE